MVKFISSTIYFFLFQSFFLGFSICQTITFEKSYGDAGFEDMHCVKATYDGGYIASGTSFNFNNGSNDAMLLKIDSVGNQQWLKKYGGNGEEDIHFLSITSDSGFIFCGFSTSFSSGDHDVFIVKTNMNGDTLWTKTYGGLQDDIAYSICQSTDGKFAITGKTNSFGNGNFDIYYLNIDSDGTLITQKTFGGILDDFARFIDNTSDNGYVITGTTYNTDSADAEIVLLKINGAGDSLWSTRFDHDSSTFGYCVQQTNDGGFVIGGHGQHFDWEDKFSLIAIKTDSAGLESWRSIPPFDFTFRNSNSHSVRQTNDGGYILAGAYNAELICKDSGFYPSDLLLLKLDSTGATAWYNSFFNSGYNEMGTYAEQTSDNGFIICGYKGFDYTNDGDAIIYKTDSVGNVYTGLQDIEKPDNTNISIFPNPVLFDANLEFGPEFSHSELFVYDIAGKKIKQIKINISPFIFYRDNLLPGFYHMQLISNDHQNSASGKLIVH